MTTTVTIPTGANARVRTRTIEVACATGTGPTALAAFDSALRGTGIANYNLIRLSSVIPPATDVLPVTGPVSPPGGEWGDRLYVVYAEMHADAPGQEAWAGIGWVQQEDTGKGLFVEHEGRSEAQVRSDIERSLGSLVAGRPESFGPPRFAVHGAVSDGTPTCAFAVAVYESASWSVDFGR